MFSLQPVRFSKEFALAAALYLGANYLVQVGGPGASWGRGLMRRRAASQVAGAQPGPVPALQRRAAPRLPRLCLRHTQHTHPTCARSYTPLRPVPPPQNYFHVGDHVRGIYMAGVSNYLLSFTYAKV